jgi:exopolysaccharide biosynthesis polyprenyl glycosylphosphotransferase
VISDVLVLVWAIVGSAIVTFGLTGWPVVAGSVSRLGLSYPVLCLLMVVGWTVALAGVGSRGYRMIGTGTAEFKALFQSAAIVLIGIALASFALQIEFSRAFMLLAIPSGLIGLLVSRWLWRKWLRTHRRQGRFCSRVLLVGSMTNASKIAADLRRHTDAGYFVVGAAITTGESGDRLPGTDIRVLGTVDVLTEAVSYIGADTVIVTDNHNLSPARLRELSWSLEPGRQHLVMAPSLTDIAGPRIHARPVAGLPLVHVETPRYEGSDRFLKRAFDVGASAGLLLVLSVPLLVVAVVVATTSPGGVFFAHERIGKRGRPFKMLKFRSMVADADSRLDALLKSQGKTDQPLFKIADDPRITKIGGFLRRYSIDEVPQLINVLRGDMSLVGPRPQVAKEVALYDNAAARRLFVKPGMTGLWQVSGRSNLDWEESLRLDLYYVENWSMTADVAILGRTVRAVLAKDGAY